MNTDANTVDITSTGAGDDAEPQGHAGGLVRVWDPLVRIGHWLLVLAFAAAYLTEDDFLTVHVWAGYVVAVVVVTRIVWGFVGPQHARFADFVHSPRAVFAYLRGMVMGRAPRFLGHNPAGGAMIIALLLSLTATGFSGMMLYAIEDNAGPLAGFAAADVSVTIVPQAFADDDDGGEAAGEELWEELHELFANVTLLLAGLHVGGVLLASFVHKENLVKAMVTGRKRR